MCFRVKYRFFILVLGFGLFLYSVHVRNLKKVANVDRSLSSKSDYSADVNEFSTALSKLSANLLQSSNRNHTGSETINIVNTAIGAQRIPYVMTNIKSVVMFASRKVHFFILTDKKEIEDILTEKLDAWPGFMRNKFTYSFFEARFPNSSEIDWNTIFSNHFTIKLFLADLFEETDAMLFMDADMIALGDIASLWEKFKVFSDTQLLGMAPDLQTSSNLFYNKWTDYPFFGEFGVNSGLLLMNLTRLRKYNLPQNIIPIYHKYKEVIKLREQCLLNILFHNRTDLLHELNCAWNFISQECKETSRCHPEDDKGIKIIHGAANAFHRSGPSFEFRTIFELFESYNFDQSRDLLKEIDIIFEPKSHPHSECFLIREKLLRGIVY